VNPVFDESFTFPGVEAGRLLKRGSAVRLSVFNTDAFSKDSLVGELLLPLDEVDLQSEISVTVIRPLGHTVTKVHRRFICSFSVLDGAVVQRVRHLGLRSVGRGFKSCSKQRCVTTLGKLFTAMRLCHQAV